MGAGQSTSNGSKTEGGTVKTSYYTLLGVERSATDTEIKKAYRRLALELHPDRNYGKEEWATTRFSEIQTAHEVLSDPQERAWYDAHEASILRGSDGTDDAEGAAHFEFNVEVTSADDVAAMMGHFRRGVDFSDSPTGFFGYVKALFDKLADEERQVAACMGIDWDTDYPTFGGKSSDYSDVVRPFYGAWAGFSTVKSFAWKDKHRITDLMDRPTRRYLEKENKRCRDAGVREFNEAVRTLVAFVKKRDPRHQANVLSEKERQDAQRSAALAQAARSRAENLSRLQRGAAELPEWVVQEQAQHGDAEAGDDAGEQDTDDEEEIEEIEEFECVACRKTFKSENQFDAHERSKKHQKAAYALRKQLEKEGKLFGLDEDGDLGDDGEFTLVDDPPSEPSPQPGKGEDDNSLDERLAGLGVDSNDPEETIPDPTPDRPNGEEDATDDGGDADDNSLEPGIPIQGLDSDSDDTQPTPVKKPGKAAQKRAKRAAKQAEIDSSSSLFKCLVCNASFPSRTRMFQHIQDLGHTAPTSRREKGAKRGKK